MHWFGSPSSSSRASPRRAVSSWNWLWSVSWNSSHTIRDQRDRRWAAMAGTWDSRCASGTMSLYRMAPAGWNSLTSASVASTGSGSPAADPNRSIRLHANAWYVVISTWSLHVPRMPAVRSRIWATAARENDRNSARGPRSAPA